MKRFIAVAVFVGSLVFAAPVGAVNQPCVSGNSFSPLGPLWTQGMVIAGTTGGGIAATIDPGSNFICNGDSVYGYKLEVELHDADGETANDDGYIDAGIMRANTNGASWGYGGGASDCPTSWNTGLVFFVEVRDLQLHGGPVANRVDCDRVGNGFASGGPMRVRINADVNGHDFEVYFDTDNDGYYDLQENIVDQYNWTAGSNFVPSVKLDLLDPGTTVGVTGNHTFNQSVVYSPGSGWFSPGWDTNSFCTWHQASPWGYDCDVTSGNSFGTWSTWQ